MPSISPLWEVSDVPTNEYEVHWIDSSGPAQVDESFGYRLLKPELIESGKKYPLVLFLHGAGERGDDNKSQLAYLPAQMAQPEFRKKYPCFLLAPQCREERRWVEVHWGDKKSSPLAEEPSDMLKIAVAILDRTVAKYPVDPQRIYLTGLSMGGYGAWELAMRQPARFAAVAPVCGGGDQRQAWRLVDVPIWAWHGSADPAVPVERSRCMIDAIMKAGGRPKYTELDGVRHDSWTEAYESADGLVPWMFEQALFLGSRGSQASCDGHS